MRQTTHAFLPREIGRAHAHDVKVIWRDGHESVYAARALRLQCPCAGCVDEMTGDIRVVAADIPADVRPLGIQAVGRYGMRVQWSDGHGTGIYTFVMLRASCPCQACRHEGAPAR